MTTKYRIIFETYDVNTPSEAISRAEIVNEELNKPSNCLDFSMGLDNQIALIKGVQDKVLQEKIELLHNIKPTCPDCNINLHKTGTHKSTFHDVFTDHQVIMQRFKCHNCGYETRSTVRTLFNGVVSGDLKKIQATLGATHSFRESEKLFELFSGMGRQINNHDRIKHITESVGNALEQINSDEKEMLITQDAEELILNVDGGHIKTTEDQRSMEAMVSVIYRPESIKSNSKDTKNYIISKNCAASIKDDQQNYMISSTIIAALKQGLSPKTHVTALCDGAANCWNIAKAIEPLCSGITYILDWFHLAMKFENISLPKKLKEDLMHIKWHLWRGDVSKAIIKFKEILDETIDEKHHSKIKKLSEYIENNRDKIVNYLKRQEQGLVFTSNLAESTVESLINQRCKGQQHMRWSREGLNPILQLRAAIHSNDWSNKWKTAVLNAV